MKKTLLTHCWQHITNNYYKHPHKNYKHFCFVVQNDSILEVGVNRPNAYPPIYYGFPANARLHAEIDAWRKARGILDPKKSFEVVNLRIRSNLSLGNSKPCECCRAFLKAQGCRTIYYMEGLKFMKANL